MASAVACGIGLMSWIGSSPGKPDPASERGGCDVEEALGSQDL